VDTHLANCWRGGQARSHTSESRDFVGDEGLNTQADADGALAAGAAGLWLARRVPVMRVAYSNVTSLSSDQLLFCSKALTSLRSVMQLVMQERVR
jgi:hypothetical protein